MTSLIVKKKGTHFRGLNDVIYQVFNQEVKIRIFFSISSSILFFSSFVLSSLCGDGKNNMTSRENVHHRAAGTTLHTRVCVSG
jgi:hypothetical protein